MADGGDGGAGGGGRFWCLCNKDCNKPFVLFRCNSWTRTPLFKHSLGLLSAVQLPGKTHKHSDHTFVIAIVC